MDLNKIQKAILLATFIACKKSLHAHVPIQAILKRIRKEARDRVLKKEFRRLMAKGLIRLHPTKREGWELARKIAEEELKK